MKIKKSYKVLLLLLAVLLSIASLLFIVLHKKEMKTALENKRFSTNVKDFIYYGVESAQDAFLSENILLFLNSDYLYTYNLIEDTTESFVNLHTEYCRLCMYGDELFLISDTGRIDIYNSLSLFESGIPTQSITFFDNIGVPVDIQANNDNILVHFPSSEYFGKIQDVFLIVNRKNGDTTVLNNLFDKRLYYCCLDGDRIICVPEDGSVAYIDKHSKIKYLCRLSIGIKPHSLTIDRKHDVLYYFDGKSIGYVIISKNTSGIISTPISDISPSNDFDIKLYCYNEHIILIDIIKQSITDIFETVENEENHTIKVLLNEQLNLIFGSDAHIGGIKNASQELFDKEVVTTVLEGGLYGDDSKIKLKLLACESDFDLFGIQHHSVEYYAMAGAIYDLSYEENIINNFELMYDGIRELCTVDNILCGVPLSYSLHACVYTVNLQLMEEMKIDLPDTSITWDEMEILLENIMLQSDINNISDFVPIKNIYNPTFYAEYLSNYCSYYKKTVEDKRDVLVKCLNIYQELLQKGLIANSNENMNTSFNYLFSKDDIGPNKDNLNHAIYPMPLLESGTRYPVSIELLAVNPHSPYIEDAVRYLECISSSDVLQQNPSYPMLKSSKYTWDLPWGTQEFDWKQNPLTEWTLSYVFKNSIRSYSNSEIRNKMDNTLIKLLENNKDFKEYSDELYTISKMIICE